MAARLGQGDLIAGGGAAALLLLLLVLGMNPWLAVVLAIAAYAGAVLVRPQRPQPASAPAETADDIQRHYGEAIAHLAAIRENETRIANPAVHDQVGRIANTLDATLAAMVEDSNLAAAPLFNNQLVEPFDALLTHYVRLSNRGVRSANEAIEKAETHDFPMIESAAQAFYEKLNRANVVDLAALGEVLELNIESLNTQKLRRSAP